MIEEWKIYKCKKDKNHPYASVWEISSYGRVKREGGLSKMYKLKIREKEAPFELMSTMGCRTQNGADCNIKESFYKNIKSLIYNNELYDNYYSAVQKDGRGNICPVTIIMPTLAMEAKEKAKQNNTSIIDEFFTILDTKIHEAKDMLLERFEWICSQPPESARFMWENNTMAGYVPKEGIRSALKHGTLAVGQIGLAETLQILIGTDHTTPEGMDLAKKIESLFKARCAEFKEEYKLNFGVYYSPAESLCHTAMQKFKQQYGEIPDVSDREYFTNSIHVPVWYECDPFEKIDIEAELINYSNAGAILYVELDASVRHNIDALETIVKYAMKKDIPYFAINVPNDTCLDCGFTGEFNDTCPICGSDNIQQLRRVTGYLSTTYKHFNRGKQQEVEQRVKHEKVVK